MGRTITFLKVCEERAMSASDDSSVCVRCIVASKCLAQLWGYAGEVLTVAVLSQSQAPPPLASALIGLLVRV